MTEDQFHLWINKRRALVAVLNSSEGLLAFVAAAWGMMLVSRIGYQTYDAVAAAIAAMLPSVAVHWHGVALIVVSILHCIGIYGQNVGVRKACIMAQLLFFTYAWCALLQTHTQVLPILTLPVYVLACSCNYILLAAHKSE